MRASRWWSGCGRGRRSWRGAVVAFADAGRALVLAAHRHRLATWPGPDPGVVVAFAAHGPTRTGGFDLGGGQDRGAHLVTCRLTSGEGGGVFGQQLLNAGVRDHRVSFG